MPKLNLDVHVDSVDGSQMAARIIGTFVLDGTKYPFMAIAFGRIGGQNIGAKIDKNVEESLKKAGHDPEEVAIKIQRLLLAGDMTIPDNLKKESFIDD